MAAAGGSRRRWFKIALPIIVAAILITGAVGVMTYRPLKQGSAAQGPKDSIKVANPAGEISELPTVRMPYHDGATNSFAFSVKNGGRFGVTIVDFPILHENAAYNLFEVTKAEVGDPFHMTEPFTPFRPFSLAAGQQVLVRLTGNFTDCEWYAPASTNGFRSVLVEYRYLWSTRTADISLPFELEVESPPADQCPRELQYD